MTSDTVFLEDRVKLIIGTLLVVILILFLVLFLLSYFGIITQKECKNNSKLKTLCVDDDCLYGYTKIRSGTNCEKIPENAQGIDFSNKLICTQGHIYDSVLDKCLTKDVLCQYRSDKYGLYPSALSEHGNNMPSIPKTDKDIWVTNSCDTYPQDLSCSALTRYNIYPGFIVKDQKISEALSKCSLTAANLTNPTNSTNPTNPTNNTNNTNNTNSINNENTQTTSMVDYCKPIASRNGAVPHTDSITGVVTTDWVTSTPDIDVLNYWNSNQCYNRAVSCEGLQAEAQAKGQSVENYLGIGNYFDGVNPSYDQNLVTLWENQCGTQQTS
jgi:hypothetical protein